MIGWKRALSICICINLLGSSAVYGMVSVPPAPTAGLGSVTAAPGGSGINTITAPGTTNPGTTAPAPGAVGNGSAAAGPGVSGIVDQTDPQTKIEQAVTSAAASTSQPEIQAQGVYLLDAETGKALYEKNGGTQFYPASITKILTVLLAIENTNLDDVVTFSKSATTNLEAGSVTLNLVEGDKLTVRQCLYALLLKSANEVANGLAEHVSGSVSAFAEKMNQKAAELGCTNTHFANPHGLNNSNHYTTPRDMALIAREAFKNQTLREINQTLAFQIPATKNAGVRTVTLGHKMFYPTDSRYYSGIIGGKTGYTSLAGNTLVTCVERDGIRLIVVIMKSKSTQYTDTKLLLDYGFANRNIIINGTMADARWEKSESGWYFVKTNGQRASNQWMDIDGVRYWFDENGLMATGWRKQNQNQWYYYKKSGAMAVNYWVQDQGVWFYLGADGVMLRDTVTPDGYKLGSDGTWMQ